MKRALAIALILISALPLVAGFNFTSLNAVTGTGAGEYFQPGKTRDGFTWSVATTGSPTGITVNLEGSLEGVTWYTLDSSTSTSGEMRHVVNKDVKYMRCNLATLTGGTAPTVTCKVYQG